MCSSDLTAGTLSNASVTAAQWKNELIVIGDPDKGLFYWSGNSAISIGSVGLIAVANGGSGYSTPPDVLISAPNETGGVQATATASITTGSGGVDAVIVDNAGTGYTSVPSVVIGSPNLANGTQATASASITSGGSIVYITVSNPGSGYTTTPSVTISGGGGSSGNAVAIISTGKVTSVNLTNAGTGYTSPPTITLSGGGGTGANVVAQINTFKTGTVSVLLTNGGSGYTNVANITVSIGNATGWTTQATAVATLSGNAVAGNDVLISGTGSDHMSGDASGIIGPDVITGQDRFVFLQGSGEDYIDDFRQVNNRWGHQAGDQVLCDLCQLARQRLRPQDLFRRIGDEEFAVLLPECDAAEAMAIAEGIRQDVAAMQGVFSGSDYRPRLSGGVTSLVPADEGFAEGHREQQEQQREGQRAGQARSQQGQRDRREHGDEGVLRHHLDQIGRAHV